MTGPASPEPATRPATSPRSRSGGLRGWLAASAVIIAGTVAVRLPDGLVWGMGNLLGRIAYRASKPRRERARRNLRRIVGWMAATGTGPERYRRAASDPRALESLVRSAFCQHAHYSLELVRVPRFTQRYMTEHMAIDTPEVVEEGLSVRRAVIVLGMHLGAIEMPGIYCVGRLGPIVAPMETVANDRIQRYLYTSRATIGVRIVGLEDGRELVAALRRNEPVGVVGDRAITGAGIDTDFFGSPAKIPAGPAFLAVESGAPIYAGAARRTGPGRYLGSLRAVPIPPGGSRKERIHAIVEAEARIFEQLIAQAPDQWLAVFHPVWPDLEQTPGNSNGEAE